MVWFSGWSLVDYLHEHKFEGQPLSGCYQCLDTSEPSEPLFMGASAPFWAFQKINVPLNHLNQWLQKRCVKKEFLDAHEEPKGIYSIQPCSREKQKLKKRHQHTIRPYLTLTMQSMYSSCCSATNTITLSSGFMGHLIAPATSEVVKTILPRGKVRVPSLSLWRQFIKWYPEGPTTPGFMGWSAERQKAVKQVLFQSLETLDLTGHLVTFAAGPLLPRLFTFWAPIWTISWHQIKVHSLVPWRNLTMALWFLLSMYASHLINCVCSFTATLGFWSLRS